MTKAIKTGRLLRTVVMVNGLPKICSMAAADAEWAANTRSEHAAQPPRVNETRAPMAPPQPPSAPQPGSRAAAPADYAEARYWREIELWRQAAIKAQADELELATARGEMVSVAEARAAVIERFTVVKTKLLGVPTRVHRRLPHLTAEDIRVIDDAMREALEELAADAE